jgi:hypothetical protein
VADENMLANEILLLAWKKQSDEKGILLRISKPVERLLHYLEEHAYINLNQFCRIAHINYYTAKNILSDLMATHTLRYNVVDKRIVYERMG